MEEDLLDEIVMDIVSRLKKKEAGEKCSLVSGWRNLWKRSRNLDLDFGNKKYNGELVAECIDHVLMDLILQKEDMDNMRIAFRVDDDTSFHGIFEEWLEFANLRRVKSLTIDLKMGKNVTPGEGSGSTLFSLGNWNRLSTLCLKSVAIDNVLVQLLLNISPNLETLVLENVPVTQLELFHTKLKRLELQNCVQTFSAEWAPNLEYFKHVPVKKHKDVIIDLFEESPKLGAVYLGGPLCRHSLAVLAEKATRLQKLQLEMDVYCEHEDNCWGESKLLFIPAFKNVKQLELRFTATQQYDEDYRQMSAVLELIDKFPTLEKLALKYEIQRDGDDDYYDDEGLYVDVGDYPFINFGANERLREVQVVGWSGQRSEVGLIRYLIDTYPNIRRLLLDPTPPHQVETSWPATFSHVPKLKREVEAAARVAQKVIGYLHMNKPKL